MNFALKLMSVQQGLNIALNLSYHQTAPYIKPYVMEELEGIADSTKGAVSLVDVRNVMWLGEITRGSCSMFGAKDSATEQSRAKIMKIAFITMNFVIKTRSFA